MLQLSIQDVELMGLHWQPSFPQVNVPLQTPAFNEVFLSESSDKDYEVVNKNNFIK